jgi:hypothetical protein
MMPQLFYSNFFFQELYFKGGIVQSFVCCYYIHLWMLSSHQCEIFPKAKNLAIAGYRGIDKTIKLNVSTNSGALSKIAIAKDLLPCSIQGVLSWLLLDSPVAQIIIFVTQEYPQGGRGYLVPQ